MECKNRSKSVNCRSVLEFWIWLACLFSLQLTASFCYDEVFFVYVFLLAVHSKWKWNGWMSDKCESIWDEWLRMIITCIWILNQCQTNQVKGPKLTGQLKWQLFCYDTFTWHLYWHVYYWKVSYLDVYAVATDKNVSFCENVLNTIIHKRNTFANAKVKHSKREREIDRKQQQSKSQTANEVLHIDNFAVPISS